MFKRTAALFCIFVFTAFFAILAVFHLSVGDGLAEAAADQQTDTLTVSAGRGAIYDRNLVPLTGIGEQEYPTAVIPSDEAAAVLFRSCSATEMKSIEQLLSKNTPFTLKLPIKIAAPGVDVFPQKARYSAEPLAAHIVGYLNGSGIGTAGIEKAFDGYLSSGQGKITVSYQTDALGHILSGQERTVTNDSALRKRGVVLTIDKSIQQLTERSLAHYLKKGAAVVLDVPSGKILALASLPTFSQNNVASVLKSADSPLLDRATSAYSVGSVFKLAAAASALESGVSPDTKFTCSGAVDVDGQAFHCYDGEKHGSEDMEQAIANSCNTYFIRLMQRVPPKNFLQMVRSLGFGSAFEIAPGLTSDAGVLPKLSSLSVPRSLANFSFGQGELTATPLQTAAMINAIASGGNYTQPYLYAGEVDENLHFTDAPRPQKSTNVMSKKTASLLRKFMKASADSGTGQKGKPLYGSAGVKTATAQTGRYVNGKEFNDCWFAGFYPFDNPKFVIVIFSEGGDSGGTVCGPVFRDIADGLYGYVS